MTEGVKYISPFEILAGSRRYRASKIAGRESVPAVIRDLDDVAALELAIIENQQRDDVHPLDEAEGYRALMKADKSYTAAVVAAKVGKPEPYIYRRLKLLELEAPLTAALAEDRLSVAHAERLLRLTPELRKEAAHPHTGVVWRHNPLLDDEEGKWIPQREDLRPLNELEAFIRTRSHFDPTSEAARHLQPALAEQLDEAIDEEFTDTTDTPQAVDEFVASLLELSADPMARMRLKAKPNEKIPLTPSQWREVKSAKDRCAFTKRGVITHGGPTRILEVCTKRSCPKHFGKPKLVKRRVGATAAPAPKAESFEERYAREDRERKVRQEAWDALLKVAGPAMAAHTAAVRFSASLVREVLDPPDVRRVQDVFGVSLTDKTAAHVLLLSNVRTWNREAFLADAKPLKFNLGTIEQRLKADTAKAAKAANKAIRKTTAAPTAKKAKAAKRAAKKGGR